MSYQVLARKWRPSTFIEMVGQKHTLSALIHALDNNRLHHAYLFTGTRGIGKTTVARILAKSLNCERGISSAPCNECSACSEINEGRFIDLIEVDAASKTKVEDTRELLDNVQYAPTVGRYKIYLIDEVHMLSNHSFNALLKTLEEPPPHVKFLLATTDPQKLPVTVLSRCLQFSLKNLLPEQIVEQLDKVLTGENVEFESNALTELALSADGSMRDALSLTDQAIAHGGGKVIFNNVVQMLGIIDRSKVVELLECLFDNNGEKLMLQIADLALFSPDYLSVLDELISLLHRISVEQISPSNSSIYLDNEVVAKLAADKRLSIANIQVYYQIAIMGRRDISLAPSARIGFEMVLLRMLSFQLISEPQTFAEQLNTDSYETTSQAPNESLAQQPKIEPAPEPVNSTCSSTPVPKPEKWGEFYCSHRIDNIKVNDILNNCSLQEVNDNVLTFHLNQDNAERYDETNKAIIEQELSKVFTQGINIEIIIAPPQYQTPQEHFIWQQQNQKDSAIEHLKNNAGIQKLNALGASMDENAVTIKHDSSEVNSTG